MALADLDELLVRATFSSVPLAASISGVSLEVAQPGPPRGPPALDVEECRCPPGYVGLSCQVSVASPDTSTLMQLVSWHLMHHNFSVLCNISLILPNSPGNV